MGKTADFKIVQHIIIDTLYKVGKPQKVIAKEARSSHNSILLES